MSLTYVSVSKSSFYNDRVSHPEADKTLTDSQFSYQYYCSSFDHRVKKSRSAEKLPGKKNHNRPKNGSAKTIFGPKGGPAMAGSAVPPTTALLDPVSNTASIRVAKFSGRSSE